MAALLERTDELDALTGAVREAGRSRGSAVLISGEAGIGKTSLVRAFAGRVAGRVRLLVGGCDDLVTARPLGPLRDAVAGSAGPLETALGTGGDVFAAVVDELSGPGATTLVVEDLHWADDATLDVLGYLARRLADLRAVVVLTYRTDAAPAHPIHRLLGTLVGGPVVRLPLRSLSPAAVAELAAGSGRDPDQLLALTDGNPFYVTEALAAGGPGVPDSVADAVLARMARLDSATRAAVEQLSVVPAAVGLDLAHALLGERLDALAAAEASGIITSGNSGLTFRHELARQAVEVSLPRLRRRTLHRAVVAALQTRPAPDVARLVHHAIAADDGTTVSRFAPLAGREAAAAGSHRQALSHFSAALHHGHRLAGPELARLVDEHAWELYNAGHFAEARHGGERAVRLRREGSDRVALAEALVRLSRHRFMAGDPDGADAAAEEATALLGATGPQEARAFAATYLGATRALTERSAEAPGILRRARRLATSAGSADLVALCRNYEGSAREDLGDDARLAMLRGSLESALAHGFHEVAARGYTNLGELCFRFSRLDELERCVAEGRVFTEERGFSSHAHNLEVHRGLLALRRGDWQRAEDILREVAGRAEPGMPNAAGPYGRLLARRGAPEAEELLERAWDAARRQRSVTELAIAGSALVEWGWLVGAHGGLACRRDPGQARCPQPPRRSTAHKSVTITDVKAGAHDYTRCMSTGTLSSRRPDEPAPELSDYTIVHRAMTTDLRRLGELVDRVAQGRERLGERRASALREYLVNVDAEIRSHHQVEDDHVWPLLVAVAEGPTAGLADLTGDHGELDPLLDAAERLAGQLAERPEDRKIAANLTAVLTDVSHLLDRHVADEERIVFPLICEYVRVDDYRRLQRRFRGNLSLRALRFVVPWVVSHATAAEGLALRDDAGLPLRALLQVVGGRFADRQRLVFG